MIESATIADRRVLQHPYQLHEVPGALAATSLKGMSHENLWFSFRPDDPAAGHYNDSLAYNLGVFGRQIGFDPSHVTWPNGPWPHDGSVIVAEEHIGLLSRSLNGYVFEASERDHSPLRYDGIVTANPLYVLGVQGADCSPVFYSDPRARLVGIAHAGWKPVVRDVHRRMVRTMVKCGSNPADIFVHIGAGAGRRYNDFSFDESMEDYVVRVFLEAGRAKLLNDPGIRYHMDENDVMTLMHATGRPPKNGVSFDVTSLMIRELVEAGIPRRNITSDEDSTIVTTWHESVHAPGPHYKYHSCRRDAGPNPKRKSHGLALSIICIDDAA